MRKEARKGCKSRNQDEGGTQGCEYEEVLVDTTIPVGRGCSVGRGFEPGRSESLRWDARGR
jgi:hypothetical protein